MKRSRILTSSHATLTILHCRSSRRRRHRRRSPGAQPRRRLLRFRLASDSSWTMIMCSSSARARATLARIRGQVVRPWTDSASAAWEALTRPTRRASKTTAVSVSNGRSASFRTGSAPTRSPRSNSRRTKTTSSSSGRRTRTTTAWATSTALSNARLSAAVTTCKSTL